MAPMTILQSQILQEYILKTSAYPREHEQLKEIRKATVDKYKDRSKMVVPADEAQFLSMLLKIMNAKKTVEIGVFTCYSLLTTALALPHDGKVLAIDPDREAYETGLPFVKKAGVEHKVEFVQADAKQVLNDLIDEGGNEGTFDFAFVDAIKQEYSQYHELLLKLVKVGGIIAYDNTLWFGSVAVEEDERVSDDFLREGRKALIVLNKFLANDPRIESSLISIGDGLTLCKRLY